MKPDEIKDATPRETPEDALEISNSADESGDISGENMENETQAEEEAEQDPLAALKKQYDEMYDRWQRTLAEFDNFRKRSVKEKTAMYDMGVMDTVEKLLPVVDNFERALQWAPKTESQEENNYYKGVEMIFRQFVQALEGLGVEPIPSLGGTFDHNLHDAAAHVEDEAYGTGEVIEEMQKGYKYKDKVIRHSMVKVAN